MKKYDAVISGYICVDLIPDFKKNEPATSIFEILKPGRLIEIDGLSATLGGVVANTGMAMKKFSKNVFLNGVIGDDFIGKIARKWLDEHGFEGNIKTMKREGTAFGLVIAPPGVDRIFLESPGCSQLFDNTCINFNAIAQSRLFHFGYPPLLKQFYLNDGIRLIELFAEVQKMGVTTSMDFSLPDGESESGKINWPEILERVLAYTDIFVPSLEEALQIMMPSTYTMIQTASGDNEIIDLVPFDTIRALGKRMIDMGVKIALIKAGHRGAYLWTGDVTSISQESEFYVDEKHWNFRELWCNAYPVDHEKIKSASGAGDTAAAAFLAAMLNNERPESALKYAAIAGRNNLYCYDIYEELSDWSAMTNQIQNEPVRIIDLKHLNKRELHDIEMTASKK